VASSLAADSRRARNWLLRTAITLSQEPNSVSGAFSNFAGRFTVRRQAGIYARLFKSPNVFLKRLFSYPPPLASAWEIELSAVHNAVDKVIGRRRRGARASAFSVTI
jgi:hypothetical protein